MSTGAFDFTGEKKVVIGRVGGENPPGRSQSGVRSAQREVGVHVSVRSRCRERPGPPAGESGCGNAPQLRTFRRFFERPAKLRQNAKMHSSSTMSPTAMPASTQNCGGKRRMSESSM